MKEKALFDGGLSIRVGRKRIFDSDDCTGDSFSLRFTTRPSRLAKNAISLIVYLDFNAKKRNSFIKQKYSIITSTPFGHRSRLKPSFHQYFSGFPHI